MAQARVVHTSRVAPSPSPAADHELSLPLTFMDAMWLFLPPVERVLLYRVHSDVDVGDLVARLTRSLSDVLAVFFPLAGLLRPTPGASNRYDLFYSPGDGVSFTVAECGHLDVDELAADEPKEVAKVSSLVPPLPEGGAVLSLQATALRGGVALGVTLHHAACDGAASTRFLHAWAKVACGGAGAAALEPPVLDRTCVRDRDDLYDAFATTWLNQQGGGDGARKHDVDRLFSTFTLSKEHLQSVKDAVAGETSRRGVPPPRCTSTVAALGFVWHCYCRAKADAGGGDRAHCISPIDHRARLDPPVPERYLGNCVGACFASAPWMDITAAGAGGLLTACSAVATSFDEAMRGEPEYWSGWVDRMMEMFASGQLLTVAGSPRFRVYDLDFGFGRPAKVEIVSVAKTGAVSLAEARDGGGGIELGISLPADGMERFGRCFADAIDWISA